jgi:exonuclease SbcC
MLDAANRDVDERTRAIARLESDEARIEAAIERARLLREQLASMKASWQLARDLGTLLRADNFQEFVVREAMDVLAAAASEHLKVLHDRYAISVEGSEFVVIDGWHGGQRRPAKTLSGGETFVASLALALALSERLPELRSAAASPLESLFLDEGFGTLDPVALETVITALEGLRSEERMVGIITHVPELAERVEHRIVVRASPEGSSVETAGV